MMLLAVRPAVVRSAFDDTAIILPLFTRLPASAALAELPKSITAVAPRDTLRLPAESSLAASRISVPRITVRSAAGSLETAASGLLADKNTKQARAASSCRAVLDMINLLSPARRGFQ